MLSLKKCQNHLTLLKIGVISSEKRGSRLHPLHMVLAAMCCTSICVGSFSEADLAALRENYQSMDKTEKRHAVAVGLLLEPFPVNISKSSGMALKYQCAMQQKI